MTFWHIKLRNEVITITSRIVAPVDLDQEVRLVSQKTYFVRQSCHCVRDFSDQATCRLRRITTFKVYDPGSVNFDRVADNERHYKLASDLRQRVPIPLGRAGCIGVTRRRAPGNQDCFSVNHLYLVLRALLLFCLLCHWAVR